MTLGSDPMGEYPQTLCDVDASDDEAETLKQRLLAWLVSKRIVAPDITNCVLSDDGGYRPAENYGYAIYGRDAGQLDPPWLAANGLQIAVGRQVYWGGDLEAVICPHCRHRESMTPRNRAGGTRPSTMRSMTGWQVAAGLLPA